MHWGCPGAQPRTGPGQVRQLGRESRFGLRLDGSYSWLVGTKQDVPAPQAKDARWSNKETPPNAKSNSTWSCCTHFPQSKVVASLDTSNTSWIGFKTLTLACSVCTLNHVTCIPNSHIQGSEGHLIHLRAAEYGIHWLRCVLSTGLLGGRIRPTIVRFCRPYSPTSGERSQYILQIVLA